MRQSNVSRIAWMGLGAIAALAVFSLSSLQQVPKPHGSIGLSTEQQEILSHLSIVYLDDGQGGLAKTIRVSGVNVQVVNGSGSTQNANGVGNLIVGYNAPMTGNSLRTTGSHNVVVGRGHSYSSWGGVVAGLFNTISGEYSSVLGGNSNRATGSLSTASGGSNNEAAGPNASVSGGEYNSATGVASSISGGTNGVTSEYAASISGGHQNQAHGYYSWIGGGHLNSALGVFSSVTGGEDNYAFGASSSCTGGVSGVAAGDGSTLSGGYDRGVHGQYNWAAGGLFEPN